ncbi:MAG: CHAT domain-containing protein [bacterium]
MNSTKKILILSANPKDTARLRLSEEVREIREGLIRSKNRDQFIIQQQCAVRLRDLRRAMLDYEPQIVHFCGHGEENGLMVEDESGNATLVSPEALAGLFELFADQVECVLLNACYSQVQANAINKHISYVIGMKKGIKDRAAIEFAVGFYDALGAGKSVEEAFKFGRNAIQLYNIPQHLTPALEKKSTSQVQIILEGEINKFDETAQKNLLNILAAILNIDEQSIRILRVLASSIRIIVELPDESAQRLITLFKNNSEELIPLISQFQVKEIKSKTFKPFSFKRSKMIAINELSKLNEDHVCIVTERILRGIFLDEAPSVDELRLNFRIGLEDNSLLIFDLKTPEIEGLGAGGHLYEWTTTIIINLVSAVFYEIAQHGIKTIQNLEAWENVKERLMPTGGKTKFLIESEIENVRKAILETLSFQKD